MKMLAVRMLRLCKYIIEYGPRIYTWTHGMEIGIDLF